MISGHKTSYGNRFESQQARDTLLKHVYESSADVRFVVQSRIERVPDIKGSLIFVSVPIRAAAFVRNRSGSSHAEMNASILSLNLALLFSSWLFADYDSASSDCSFRIVRPLQSIRNVAMLFCGDYTGGEKERRNR